MILNRKFIYLTLVLAIALLYNTLVCVQTIKYDTEVAMDYYCLVDYWVRLNHGFYYFYMEFFPAMVGCYVILNNTLNSNRVIRYGNKRKVFKGIQISIFLWQLVNVLILLGITYIIFFCNGKEIYNWNNIYSFYAINTREVLTGIPFEAIVIIYLISFLAKNIFFSIIIQIFMWNGKNIIIAGVISAGCCVIEAKNQNLMLLINSLSFGYNYWSGELIKLIWIIAVIFTVVAVGVVVSSVRAAEDIWI